MWTPHGSRYLTAGDATIDIGARGPMRSGHIPTAVHLHASANLDPTTWTYLPPEVLRARVEAAGVKSGARIQAGQLKPDLTKAMRSRNDR